MSYSLELYQLDWQQLAGVIGSGDQELVAAIDAASDPRMFEQPDPAGQRILWRKVVEALIVGRRGQEIRVRAQDPTFQEEVSDLTALAMCGIIRAQGTQVGTLDHSSSSGELFRDEFLGALPSKIGLPGKPEEIVSRPLSGLVHPLYPSWGGLTKFEIDQVFRTVSIENLPLFDDSDLDGWLYDFVDSLTAVQEQNSDLVTLYL